MMTRYPTSKLLPIYIVREIAGRRPELSVKKECGGSGALLGSVGEGRELAGSDYGTLACEDTGTWCEFQEGNSWDVCE